MTEERELRIPSNEIVRIAVECSACGVEITLDMNMQCETPWKEKGLECPVCHRKFDSNLRTALYYYSSWLTAIQISGEKVSFRIRRTNQ